MKELDFQRHLVKAALAQGGYAFKMSHRFLVGIPDLFVKLPSYPTTLIECKMGTINARREVSVDLTPKQRKSLRDARKAGQAAGWVVACPANKHAGGGPGQHLIVWGDNPDMTVAPETHTNVHARWHTPRGLNRDWPIEDIVSSMQFPGVKA